MDRERRIISSDSKCFEAFQSTSLARSVICFRANVAPTKCRMLRVFDGECYLSIDPKFQSVNLRYVLFPSFTLPSSISLAWNLQTLVIDNWQKVATPFEIWKLTQLRHIYFEAMLLPDPPRSDDKDDSVVLRHLQTLAVVMNFKMSEEACRRIPNIKKLHMVYGKYGETCEEVFHSVFDNLRNLGRLHRLESLTLWCYSRIAISKLKTSSLKKLSLCGDMLCYEDLSMMMIGSLPQLEVLKLVGFSRNRPQKWSCVEGEFLHLKFLSIYNGLESWTFDDGASHFPVLEKLVLLGLENLNEIPSGIAEISTLQLIHLVDCTDSLAISAMKIKEKQEYFGNYGLQILVE